MDMLHTSESLARANRALRVLSECNSALVRTPDEATLLQDMCRIVVNTGGYCVAWVGFVEQDERRSIRPVAQAGYEAGDLEKLDLTLVDQECGNGPMGSAIRTGVPQIARNNQTDSAAFRKHALHRGFAASISLPLKCNGQALGALNIHAEAPDAFDEHEVALLAELAEDLAYGIVASRNRVELDRHRNQLEEIVRERDDGYGMIVRTAMDGFWIVDTRGRFLEVNDAYCSLIGYSREELLEMSIPDIEDGETLEETAAHIHTIMRTGADRFVTRHRRKDGAVLDVEISTNYMPLHGGKFFVFVRDVTERKRMEEALKDSKRWVEEELARRSAELQESELRFRGLVEQSLAGVYIIERGKFAYVNPRFVEIFGYASDGELIGSDPLALVAEEDQGLVRENIRKRMEGEVATVSYDFTARRKNGAMIEVGVHGYKATYLGRPAIVGLIQDISEKRRADEQIRRYVTQLENAFMHTVEVATTLSEMRDPYTAGHERRVAEIAVAIGAELGFDARRQEGLRVAGYLHDVGKITIPSEILSKPGKLSAAEFALIKGHPQASYDVLKGVGFPWPVAQIALQHHERMDGSGYPQGLRGEEILLESRIMAVADVIEAMASHRPYRPGLGVDKALAEIERGRGIAYDPHVADACLRLFREKGFQLPA